MKEIDKFFPENNILPRSFKRDLKRLPDEELMRIYGKASESGSRIFSLTYSGREIPQDLAEQHARDVEIKTAVRAIARKKCVRGGPGTHKRLWQLIEVKKKMDRKWAPRDLKNK